MSRPRGESNNDHRDHKSLSGGARSSSGESSLGGADSANSSAQRDTSGSGSGASFKQAQAVGGAHRALSSSPSGASQPRAQLSQQQQSPASSSHRLSSIEILNENRQRQLQFKQQESFKRHLEQRQKLIQQQHRDSNDESTLALSYQVNTNVPDYMASAAAMASSGAGSEASNKKPGGNPFNKADSLSGESQRAGSLRRPTSAPSDEKQTTTVSGKDGFLSALIDEASFEPAGKQLDRSQEELNSSGSLKQSAGNKHTRYANVTADTGYSYDDQNPDKRPFYKKDLPSLLQECRASRKLVIAIVAIALLLDNMLLTSVVPIIPFDLLKYRMEQRQRQGELQERPTGNASSPAARTANRKQPASQGSPSLEREEQDRISKMIHQSISDAKDRWSGSVFHPKLWRGRGKQREEEGPETGGKQANEPARDRDDDNDDDEDDDDDADKPDRAPDSRDANERSSQRESPKSRRPTSGAAPGNQMRKEQSSSGQSIADEYEELSGQEEEQSSSTSAAEPARKEAAKTQKGAGEPAGKDRSRAKSAGEEKDDDEEDDDEDSVNSKRWSELKSSLISMARRSGNDTDALATVCLASVLGKQPAGDSAQSDAPDDQEDQEDQREGAAQPEQSRKAAGSKTLPARDRRRRSPRVERLRPIRPRVIRPTPRPAAASEQAASSERPDGLIQLEGMLAVSHQDIVDESFEVGVMFASKPIVQAIANPFIGTLTNKVGFTIPMFTGFLIMFISTLVFAFGSSYSTLFIARAIQGVGSACTSVAGMSMLADTFPDDAERGNAMAIALGGLALGVIIGPPFGGFMYEFVGRSSPFIVLSFLALLDGLLQLLVLQPRVTKSQEEGASLLTLIKDPYILVAAGAITFANTGIAILEPALPLWMMDTMNANNWQQGVAFLPAALSYMFGTNLLGNLGHKIGRWRATMLGLIIIGCSLLIIPSATKVEDLIIPNGAIGFAMGMVDSTMMPMLGYLVDIRHTSVYGSVYAIGDVAFCASFAFGPALSGTLIKLIGFRGLVVTTALICFGFAPLLLLLRNPPPRQLNEAQLQEQSTLRYVNYNQLDSPDEEAHLTEYSSSRKRENNYVS